TLLLYTQTGSRLRPFGLAVCSLFGSKARILRAFFCSISCTRENRMSRIKQAKALRLTVLTAALITAYTHATPHAAEVVFDHETATLNDSPYSNTFFGLKNGSKVEASGVTIN